MKLKIFLLLIVGHTSAQDPPETWQEDWFDHNQLLHLHYFDDEVAIYFDDDMDQSLTWMNQYLHDVWVYTKDLYGQFGNDSRLYAIFHTGKYNGGHFYTYFDNQTSYRNVIDIASTASDAWTTGSGTDLDTVTQEIAHIVENASHDVHNSPAFNIWGDKWAQIFVYDVYLGIGREEDAQRWKDMQLSSDEGTAGSNSYWFSFWYMPIYEILGQSTVLNRFFDLLAANFPQHNTASLGRPEYARDMNYGEFVHFWSGAAGIKVRDLAVVAFGWNTEYEDEYVQARNDFPCITY